MFYGPELVDNETIVLVHEVRHAHEAGYYRNIVTYRNEQSVYGRRFKTIIAVRVHPYDVALWLQNDRVVPCWAFAGEPKVIHVGEWDR